MAKLRREHIKKISATRAPERENKIEFTVRVDGKSSMEPWFADGKKTPSPDEMADLLVVKDAVDNPGASRVDNLSSPAKRMLAAVVAELREGNPTTHPQFFGVAFHKPVPPEFRQIMEKSLEKAVVVERAERPERERLLRATLTQPELDVKLPPGQDLARMDEEELRDIAVQVDRPQFIDALFRIAGEFDKQPAQKEPGKEKPHDYTVLADKIMQEINAQDDDELGGMLKGL